MVGILKMKREIEIEIGIECQWGTHEDCTASTSTMWIYIM